MYYHVIAKLKGIEQRLITLDLNEKELEEKILTPYYNGTLLAMQGRSIDVKEIQKIFITRTSVASNKEPSSNRLEPSIWPRKKFFNELPERMQFAYNGELVTREFITAPLGSNKLVRKEAQKEMKKNARKVFVVHGRDERLRRSIFEFLTAIRLDPIEWPEAISSTGEGSPYVGKALKILNIAQAIVVLLTPDDLVQLREELWKDNEPQFEKQLSGQPRPNVLIELGMALAINEAATIIVQVGQIKDISDIKGRHILHLDNSAVMKNQLANRLKDAGCEVKTVGNDWLTVGDFSPPEIKIDVNLGEKLQDYKPDEVAANILLHLSKSNRGLSVGQLAQFLNEKPEKIKYYLHQLSENEYVDFSLSFSRDTTYHLKQGGREFLVKKNLL